MREVSAAVLVRSRPGGGTREGGESVIWNVLCVVLYAALGENDHHLSAVFLF